MLCAAGTDGGRTNSGSRSGSAPTIPNVFNDPELAPTYNAAPQSFQPVIRLDPDTGERD